MRRSSAASVRSRSSEMGTTDMTYAFALFNLGHALRLAGRLEEAIRSLSSASTSRTRATRSGGTGGGDRATAEHLSDEEDEGWTRDGKAKGHDKD